MKNKKSIFCLLVLIFSYTINAQKTDDDYITFDDRRNVVHGVYVGANLGFGEIDGKNTGTFGLKFAYVANQQLEVGLSTNFFYSEQKVFNPMNNTIDDLLGFYAGLHLEPILFGKSTISVSFPILIGGGFIAYAEREAVMSEDENEPELDEDDFDGIRVFEPGINALFNITRFTQLETGVKYRFSNKIDLVDSPLERVNGFTFTVGIKLGIFNMGKNRYKKNIKDEE